MHTYRCETTGCFDDDDVIDWLFYNGKITEEERESYVPTEEDLLRYAWAMIENDEGEYGVVHVDD